MKTKFIVSIVKLQPDLFGSIIKVEVLERKYFFQCWKKSHEIKARCKSWNGYEGYEWYDLESKNRIAWEIEEQAEKLAQEILKKRFTILPGMVDWKALKEKYPI